MGQESGTHHVTLPNFHLGPAFISAIATINNSCSGHRLKAFDENIHKLGVPTVVQWQSYDKNVLDKAISQSPSSWKIWQRLLDVQRWVGSPSITLGASSSKHLVQRERSAVIKSFHSAKIVVVQDDHVKGMASSSIGQNLQMGDVHCAHGSRNRRIRGKTLRIQNLEFFISWIPHMTILRAGRQVSWVDEEASRSQSLPPLPEVWMLDLRLLIWYLRTRNYWHIVSWFQILPCSIAQKT